MWSASEGQVTNSVVFVLCGLTFWLVIPLFYALYRARWTTTGSSPSQRPRSATGHRWTSSCPRPRHTRRPAPPTTGSCESCHHAPRARVLQPRRSGAASCPPGRSPRARQPRAAASTRLRTPPVVKASTLGPHASRPSASCRSPDAERSTVPARWPCTTAARSDPAPVGAGRIRTRRHAEPSAGRFASPRGLPMTICWGRIGGRIGHFQHDRAQAPRGKIGAPLCCDLSESTARVPPGRPSSRHAPGAFHGTLNHAPAQNTDRRAQV